MSKTSGEGRNLPESEGSGGRVLRKRGTQNPKPTVGVDLPVPISIFKEANLLRIEREIENNVAESSAMDELKALTEEAQEFLSVQAEMLVKSRKYYKAKPKLLDASFTFLTLKKECNDGNDGVYSAASINKIEAAIGVNRETNFGRLLAHEMTHALDDIYDNHSSIDREMSVLVSVSIEEQKKIILKVKEVFARDIYKVFQTLYIDPAFNDGQDFAGVCIAALENTEKPLSKEEQNAMTLSKEFVSFSYETLFYEMQSTKSESFIERYNALRSSPEGQKAQELIAASVYGVNQHIIEHIEEHLTTERHGVLTKLQALQEAFQEPYERARKEARASTPLLWTISTVRARMEKSRRREPDTAIGSSSNKRKIGAIGDSGYAEGRAGDDHASVSMPVPKWYEPEQLVKAISRRTGLSNDNIRVCGNIAELEGVFRSLPETGEFHIAINVNVVSGKFEEGRNNHWVGVHMSKGAAGIEIKYLDPMGREISDEFHKKLAEVGEISEPTLGKGIQNAMVDQSSGISIFEGNTNDCGPMLAYLFGMSSKNRLGEIQPLDHRLSNELGQKLREEDSAIELSSKAFPDTDVPRRVVPREVLSSASMAPEHDLSRGHDVHRLRSTIKTRSEETLGKDSRHQATRMRAALTRAEIDSAGRVKYGILKRTVSPIRTKQSSDLGEPSFRK